MFPGFSEISFNQKDQVFKIQSCDDNRELNSYLQNEIPQEKIVEEYQLVEGGDGFISSVRKSIDFKPFDGIADFLSYLYRNYRLTPCRKIRRGEFRVIKTANGVKVHPF